MATIGELPPGAEVEKVEYRDEWYEAQCYIPGMEKDSDHQFAFPIGKTMYGCFYGLREQQKPDKRGFRKTWARFQDHEGNRFRIKCYGQLIYELKKYKDGEWLGIQYCGTEFVEGMPNDCHKFEVFKVKLKK